MDRRGVMGSKEKIIMTEIEWEQVESSNLDALSYNEEEERLYIRFKNGSVYQYDGVPKYEDVMLRSAPSLGRYFNEHIKGVYPHEKIT